MGTLLSPNRDSNPPFRFTRPDALLRAFKASSSCWDSNLDLKREKLLLFFNYKGNFPGASSDAPTMLRLFSSHLLKLGESDGRCVRIPELTSISLSTETYC